MKMFALFVAAWDLADRGTRPLFEWAASQGINTIFLASEYHAGWFLHSHHQSHKTYMSEEGVCYFHPSADAYTETNLKPLVAQIARERDWVREARTIADQLGMKLFLWTVCLHNTRLGLRHPETACRNAFGDLYPHALCPTHPQVRGYIHALVHDQLRYAPDGFFLEAIRYMGRQHGHHHERDGLPLPPLEQHLLNLSFAASDIDAAMSRGVDGARLAGKVASHLESYFTTAPRRPLGLPATLDQFCDVHPDLTAYEAIQRDACDSLVQEIGVVCAPRGVKLLGDAQRGLDLIYHAAYNQSAEMVKRNFRDGRSESRPVVIGLRLGSNPAPETPAINSQAQACEIARVASRKGAHGLAFYFYGEAPWSALQWIKLAIDTVQQRLERPHSSRREKTDERFRVGLIGCGAAGYGHLQALADLPNVELTAVMDKAIHKAQHLAKRLGIPRACDDVDALLSKDDLDLVVVATPPNSHVEIARRVSIAGTHILFEKPFGLNLQDADKILEQFRRSERLAAPALLHRYNGARWAARLLIQRGAIGSIRLVRHRYGIHMYDDPRFVRPELEDRGWLTDRATAGGGILPSASIHSLSALSYILGNPRFLSARGSVRQLHPKAFEGIEDDVSLIFEVGNGAQIVFEESWVVPMAYETQVFGDRGWLRMNGKDFTDIALSAVCDGPVPSELQVYSCDGKLVLRPHELDDVVPCGFAGLAQDIVLACRGQHRPDLPDMNHARNMRAVIDAALGASALGTTLPISWKSASASDLVPSVAGPRR